MSHSSVEMDESEEIESVLAELFVAIPLLTGSLVASVDGRPIAGSFAEENRASAAAIVASSLALSQRLVELAGPAQLSDVVAKSSDGLVAAYAVGDSRVLLVTSKAGINQGLLHLKVRKVIARLVDLQNRRTEAMTL